MVRAVKPVLLFDLDDTLMVEEPAAVAAFQATADFAGAHRQLDTATLALAARARARQLWLAAPMHPYCRRVGISSWEGLWCRFEGEHQSLRSLRDWSGTYRREAWRLALAEQQIHDDALAEELGERFCSERRARHEVFSEVPDALRLLAASHTLGLLTNGAACLQREKLASSGLGSHFQVVVVAGEFGAGKPDTAIFEHTLALLGARPQDATMIGDSLPRDIEGAKAAGIAGIWLNRNAQSIPAGTAPAREISSLDELAAALEQIG
jgi:putative hydrolase of the HAD superfamily